MDYFPIFTRLVGKSVLVVGAGSVACRKIKLLLAANASVTAIAPDCEPQISYWVEAGVISYKKRSFKTRDIEPHWLIVAATNDEAVNQSVCDSAALLKRFTNVVDDRKRSEFITPAIVDRAPIQVAISSGGDAPVLVRALKTDLETRLSAGFGALAEQMGIWRKEVAGRIPLVERRSFWERLLNSNLPALIEQRFNERDRANSQSSQLTRRITTQIELGFEELLENSDQNVMRGSLLIAHITSSDPELLTIKTERAMQHADTVFFDVDIESAIIDHVRRDADCISLGSGIGPGQVSLHPNNLVETTISLLRQSQRVVVLTIDDRLNFRSIMQKICQQDAFSYEFVPGVCN